MAIRRRDLVPRFGTANVPEKAGAVYKPLTKLKKTLFGNKMLTRRIEAAEEVIQAETSFVNTFTEHQKALGRLADVHTEIEAERSVRRATKYRAQLTEEIAKDELEDYRNRRATPRLKATKDAEIVVMGEHDEDDE